ncbi:MAG TPA: type 4a pilus biogenesis protein PilO [Rhodanobacteraceae bacterium]|nr:type 4a pilus biogenesis protein PilO [Rhodanobacteraceae bacterium]
MSFFDDLRNLDRNNVGGWPRSIKTFFALLIIALILLGGWWFKIRDQQADLEQQQSKELSLKKEFETKQAKVVNLPAYRKQLEDMKEMLRTMLRQLPSKTEMPDLLVDISQTALAAGIVVDLFQPGGEVVKEFYAEKPIQLKMLGTYHQFGTFISGVASLPRVVILTMHDVSLKPVKGGSQNAPIATGQLSLEGTVKTYRYVDDEEAAAAQAAAKPARKGAVPAKKPAAKAAAKKGDE